MRLTGVLEHSKLMRVLRWYFLWQMATVNVAQAEGAISGSLWHGLDVTHVKRLGTRGGLACSNWTPCEEMGGELKENR